MGSLVTLKARYFIFSNQTRWVVWRSIFSYDKSYARHTFVHFDSRGKCWTCTNL